MLNFVDLYMFNSSWAFLFIKTNIHTLIRVNPFISLNNLTFFLNSNFDNYA